MKKVAFDPHHLFSPPCPDEDSEFDLGPASPFTRSVSMSKYPPETQHEL